MNSQAPQNREYLVRFTEAEINVRVREIAALITEQVTMSENAPLTLLPILSGGMFLATDIARGLSSLKTLYKMAMTKTNLYDGGNVPGSEVGMEFDPDPSLIKGRYVIVIDDIIDSGKTWLEVHRRCMDLGAVKVDACVALDKLDVARYSLFKIPSENDFYVGYGMDNEGFDRGLPNICKLV